MNRYSQLAPPCKIFRTTNSECVDKPIQITLEQRWDGPNYLCDPLENHFFDALLADYS